MIKLNVYSSKATKKDAITLPKNLEAEVNMKLLAQAIRVYEDRRHPGLSQVKTRGEVRISTRKIYKQKGTGYARHGAKSAPIFVGGGITHGPKGVKKQLSLPKKMRQNSLKTALSLKAKSGRLIVIDNLDAIKKTKEARDFLDKIEKDQASQTKNPRFTFVVSEKNKDNQKALRNLKNVQVTSFKNLNAYDVFFAGTLILDKDVFEEIKSPTKEKLNSQISVKKAEAKLEKKVKPAKNLQSKPKKVKVSKVKKTNIKKGKKS